MAGLLFFLAVAAVIAIGVILADANEGHTHQAGEVVPQANFDSARLREGQVVLKTYSGSKATAMKLFQQDSVEMAQEGFFPTSQVWTPGRYSRSKVAVALWLCLVGVGVFILLYMVIAGPDGVLTVTYELVSEKAVKSRPLSGTGMNDDRLS
jgi:hypothetical protein